MASWKETGEKAPSGTYKKFMFTKLPYIHFIDLYICILLQLSCCFSELAVKIVQFHHTKNVL